MRGPETATTPPTWSTTHRARGEVLSTHTAHPKEKERLSWHVLFPPPPPSPVCSRVARRPMACSRPSPPQYRTAMGSNWQPDRPSPSKCSSARARGQCVASEGTRVEEGLTPVAPLFLAQ